MLDWKRYTNGTTEIEAVTLTRESAIDVMGFLMEEGKVVEGGLGAGSLSGPIHLVVNGVNVAEGDLIFKRLMDGAIGTLSPERAEDLIPVAAEEKTS